MTRNKLTPGVFLKHVVLMFMSLSALFPIYFMVITSFKTKEEYVYNKFNLPHSFSFESYSQVFSGGNFIKWFANSMLLTFSSVIVVAAIASLAAYAFARLRFRNKDILLNFIIALMVVPPVVMVIPLFNFLVDMGLINTMYGVVIIYVGLLLPFSIFLLTSFFKSIPTSIIEAAYLDGCSTLQILFRIIIPLSMPAFVTLTIVNVLWAWNELMIAVIFLQDDSLKTLMVGLTAFQSRYNLNIPVTMAGLLITTMTVLVLYIFGQRYFIKGMTAGSVKG